MALKQSKAVPTPPAAKPERTILRRTLLVLLPLIFALFVMLDAWVTEDAYITFRVLDNFALGYGFRWNVGERVEVFTHPLWMLVQLPFYLIRHEEFYTSIALSLIFAVGGYLIVQEAHRHRPQIFFSLIFMPLVFSRSYSEYSTSGLENPLTHFLLIIFFLLFLRKRPVPWFGLSLTASLLLLNRFDTLWFILPPAIFLLVTEFRAIRWWRAIAGTLPFVGWSLFSLIYYGFLFPNTKYAKLSTGIPLGDNIRQAGHYFNNFLHNDTPAAFTIAVLVGLTIYRLAVNRRSLRDPLVVSGLSVIAYLLYLFPIGSDYMAGRFFTAPLIVSVLLLAEHVSRCPDKKRKIWAVSIAGGIIVCALLRAHLAWNDMVVSMGITKSGIANERRFYRDTNTLDRNIADKRALMSHAWIRDGIGLARQAYQRRQYDDSPYVVIRGNVGMSPFFAGPGVTFLDYYALSDALLARLPLGDVNTWRIGHFLRQLPTGYRHFRETGDISRMDPDLAVYTQALHEIVTAPVWDKHRLRTLVDFHLGRYDAYRDRYIANVLRRTDWPMSRIDWQTVPMQSDGTLNVADENNIVIADGPQYRFHTEKPMRAKNLKLATIIMCDFYVDFKSAGKTLASLDTRDYADTMVRTDALVKGTIALPKPAQEQLVDEVAVRYVSYAGIPGGKGFLNTCSALPPILFYLRLE